VHSVRLNVLKKVKRIQGSNVTHTPDPRSRLEVSAVKQQQQQQQHAHMLRKAKTKRFKNGHQSRVNPIVPRLCDFVLFSALNGPKLQMSLFLSL
jgi:hypothetical protein